MSLVRSLGTRALWVVALLGMGLGGAHAQDEPLADAPMRLGPLFVTPTLELVQLGFDNNVFNESGELASDYTFRGGPRVAVELPLSRLLVTASSTIDYLYFHQFTNLRGFNIDLDTRTELRLRRVTFFLEDSFRNTTDRLNLEIDARARRMQNRTEAGLNVQLFPSCRSRSRRRSRSLNSRETTSSAMPSPIASTRRRAPRARRCNTPSRR